MGGYTITWQMDVPGDTPLEAVTKALEYIQDIRPGDPDRGPSYFGVRVGHGGGPHASPLDVDIGKLDPIRATIVANIIKQARKDNPL